MVIERQEPEASHHKLKDCSEPDDDFWALTKELEAEEANSTITTRADVTINTYIHVVAKSQKLEDGWVSDDSIKRQIDVMNESFKPRQIQFKHAGTTRTVDADLSVITEGEGTDKLGKKLRKGDYATLNLYIVKDMPGNRAGDCTLPSNNPGKEYKSDGCRFNWDTLPTKSNGRVVVHEIGHWLGLLHTFQEASGNQQPTCTTGRGDGIDDTPVHLRPNGAECKPMNTCPGQAGDDPIHNFMNYTPSKCWTGFTAGQGARMHSMWNLRKSKN
ncbi:hypothetical protein K469DRAFT_547688 [Zopfia rhizophila CBS 207.26]|uniref:Peptidase M43 pregnancy-associated plasma-A domain-containing protein n=1 Tax=Zopfia rhizophila CBS 207.26 TaxID=1314779 RepID=A0A6A6ETZ7_9PEZI|nr:hypothetical protein K469DRAFT_547688 [Zopfia rhizophila CBS 207.26]